MKEDLLKIVEHFGINNQQRKLNEEVFELQEAITIVQQGNNQSNKEITEEMADVMLLIEQFKLYYGIRIVEITNIFWYKVARTLQRIESGYYDK